MTILAAIDSYKGSLTSRQAGEACRRGILRADPAADVEVISIADGGEGSVQAIYEQLGGEWRFVQTLDLLLRPRRCKYLWLPEKQLALVECAEVLGISLIEPSAETMAHANSYGLGEMLKTIMADSPQEIIVFLGGSGTSDGGLGLLQALAELPPPAGNPLLEKKLKLPRLPQLAVKLTAAVDVSNPYVGTAGSVAVFSEQKGASKEQQRQLERAMGQVAEHYGIRQDRAGTGAAGGLGGAILSVSASLKNGFDLIAELISLERYLARAELVFTGEGAMDAQSLYGKLPTRVAEMAGKYQTPTVALVGRRAAELGILSERFAGIFPIQPGPVSLAEALEPLAAAKNLSQTAEACYRLVIAAHKQRARDTRW